MSKRRDQERANRRAAAAAALSAASDPREASSDDPIVDVAGDPYARDAVLIDTRTAVLLAGIDVAGVTVTRAGRPSQAYAVAMRGKVNRSLDEVTHLYLTDLAGLADVAGELIALASRAGLGAEFSAMLEDRLSRLPV